MWNTISIYCLFVLLGMVIGGLSAWLDFRRREGYTGFGRNRKLHVSADDIRVQYGIKLGVEAGYYAASGEEKEYSEIVREYLDRLEEDN